MDVSQVLGLSNWMNKRGGEDTEKQSLAGLRVGWVDGCHNFHIGCVKFEIFLTYQRADVEWTVAAFARMELGKSSGLET